MFGTWNDPLSTKPSRTTGTPQEWTAWVAKLTRREKDELYPGMHTDLIPAYEMITGGDPEWGTPGHSAKAQSNAGAFDETNPWDANPGAPAVQTNAWGQPVTPPDQPKTGSLWSPLPTDELSTTPPFPKKRLGILDQIRGQSHTKPASLPGSTSTNLPSYTPPASSYTPPKIYETYKPWQPYTPPYTAPSLYGTAPQDSYKTKSGSIWDNPAAESSLMVSAGAGLGGSVQTQPGFGTSDAMQSLLDSQAGQSLRLTASKNNLGILGKSLVKSTTRQNPWADDLTNSADTITRVRAIDSHTAGYLPDNNYQSTGGYQSISGYLSPASPNSSPSQTSPDIYGQKTTQDSNKPPWDENNLPDSEDLEVMPVEEIKEIYEMIADEGERRGYHMAAENLRYFLDGSGDEKHIAPNWLLRWRPVTDAVAVNLGRFEQERNPDGVVLAIEAMRAGESAVVEDYWDRPVKGGTSWNLYYASGTSTLTSTGTYELNADSEGNVTVRGTVRHDWFDEYSYEKNAFAVFQVLGKRYNLPDNAAMRLVEAGLAANFYMRSSWQEDHEWYVPV